MRGWQAAWTGTANSQRRGIEPADRQHGDVVGRECRAHEAADRFADRVHYFGSSRASGARPQHRFEPSFGEELSLAVGRFGDPVGKDINAFPRRQRRASGGVDRVRANAEDDALGAFDRREPLPIHSIRHVVAGVAVLKLAGCRPEHREEQRHEHHVAVVLAKFAVDARDDLGRRCR
jgi:hypothetical protein